MKILFASDSFKGSLTSFEIADLLKKAVSEVFPDAETLSLGVGDGGEGTVDVLVKALDGEIRNCVVYGPLGDKVCSEYALLKGGKAVIEMAKASGLTLIQDKKRDALKTSSYGTGMLIRDALDFGIRDITVAIGGSATNDGGMGAMQALGVKFFDDCGNELEGRGENLEKVKHIDISNIYPCVSEAKFSVICDVTNPLLGNEGATYVFGPQKGADEEALKKLERGMINYASVCKKCIGVDYAQYAGAGAAGGLGFALVAFLGAKLLRGIDAVLNILDFDEKLKGVDLVITGEGRMDSQSVSGKVVSGVAKRCRKYKVPVVAVVGGLEDGYESIYECGIDGVVTTIRGVTDLKNAMSKAKELYFDAAIRLLRMIRCGMNISGVFCDEKRACLWDSL